MKVAGFFSGIGGFELGFQRAGFELESVCEIELFCNQVLKKHWPVIPNRGDIRSLSAASLAKIYQLPEIKKDGRAQGLGSTATILPLSVRRTLRGLSQKMSATHGEGGCLTCGAHFTDSGMPACRYECVPLTWARHTRGRESSSLPTPTASSYGSCRGGGSGRVGKWRMSLQAMAKQNKWPTPRASDGTKNIRSPAGAAKEVARKGITGVDLSSAVGGGPLNPTWVEWLMGFPIGWTDLPLLETQSSRKSRKLSPRELGD